MISTYIKFSKEFLFVTPHGSLVSQSVKPQGRIRLDGTERVIYLSPSSMGIGYIGNNNKRVHAGTYTVLARACQINRLLDSHVRSHRNFSQNFMILLSEANGDVGLIYNSDEDMFMVVALCDVEDVS